MQLNNRPIREKRHIERYAGSSIVHANAAHDAVAMQSEAAVYCIDATMLTEHTATCRRKLQYLIVYVLVHY